MKKLQSIIIVCFFFIATQLSGSIVDQQHALVLGEKFVEANFSEPRILQWVYTASTENGRPAFYAFNGIPDGFVIVAASNLTSPILGYSERGSFNYENIPDGLLGFLKGYAQSVDFSEERLLKADFVIAQEWENLKLCGKMQSSKLDAVPPLITTHWDQECYYNEYCPEDAEGWCGHVKVGCVATAMGQIMKYWNYPEHGTGSHTNNSYFFGPLTANFGETTYHWDEMPEQLTDYNDAVATLLYHCGVATDMIFAPAPNGSGTSQNSMKMALNSYFDYAALHYIERKDYPSYDEWTSIMRHALDSEIPIAYAGTDTEQGVGGHSFICDGYDANGLFHFNWGWSGELDGYFIIDNLKTYNLAWNAYQVMIYDIRPRPVYENTPQAPADFSVEPNAEDAYTCTISWVNPVKKMNNGALSTIDQIVVKRDGQVIFTEDDVIPGAVMVISDEVPFFNIYDYAVYAVYQGNHGETAIVKEVRFGPSCQWSVETSATAPGWGGATFFLYNNAGQQMERISPTVSSQTFSFPVPLGKITFGCDKGNSTATANNVTFTLKDADGQPVYHYSGSPDNLPDGIFLTMNNSCGHAICEHPIELYAWAEEDHVVLNWSAAEGESFYNVYRDGMIINTIKNGSLEYVDENTIQGGHCYFVTAFCEGGESDPTNEACATVGDGCDPATGLWYEMTPNNKIKLIWDPPQQHEGLSGYYLYRTKESDMDWMKIKTLGSGATSFIDNASLEDESFYLYKLVAYYKDINCYSAPARSKYNEFEYFLRVYWSVDKVEEMEKEAVKVYPNPASATVRIEGVEVANVQIYNHLGQLIKTEQGTNIISVVGIPDGVYLFRIIDIEEKIYTDIITIGF